MSLKKCEVLKLKKSGMSEKIDRNFKRCLKKYKI